MGRRDLKAKLGRFLDLLMAEPLGWDLDGEGRYRRGVGTGEGHVHARLLAER